MDSVTKWLLIVGISMVVIGCGPNQRMVESGRENQPAGRPNNTIAPAARSFESDIESMRTAEFYNIYVFRRKDGGPLDADDKSFLAANLPGEINRRMLSDEGRALIAGSNFRLPDELFAALKERFAFEDFSPPQSDLPKNSGNAGAPGPNPRR